MDIETQPTPPLAKTLLGFTLANTSNKIITTLSVALLIFTLSLASHSFANALANSPNAIQVSEGDFVDDFDEDFDDIDAKLESAFLETDAQLEARYDAVHKAIQAAYNKQTSKIEVKWPNAVVVPEGAVWVAYSEDYDERVIYDFEQGFYQIEVSSDADTAQALLKLNQFAQSMQTNETESLRALDVFGQAIADELAVIEPEALASDQQPSLTLPAKTKAKEKESIAKTSSATRRGLFKPENYAIIASVTAPVPDIDLNQLVRQIEAQKLEKLQKNAKHGITLNSKGQMVARTRPVAPIDDVPTKSSVIKPTDNITMTETDNGWALKIPFVNSYQQTLLDQRMQTINTMSKRFNVDVSIILAIIEAESSFNPMATSHIPAFGLMQLVPKTAGVDAYRHVYGKHRILSPDYLYDVENNLTLGTAYIDLLQTRYLRGIEDPRNRLYSMIASYNTGVGNLANTVTGSKRIRPAISTINLMQPDNYFEFLQKNLPAQETKNYLKKVIAKQEKYAHLDVN